MKELIEKMKEQNNKIESMKENENI